MYEAPCNDYLMLFLIKLKKICRILWLNGVYINVRTNNIDNMEVSIMGKEKLERLTDEQIEAISGAGGSDGDVVHQSSCLGPAHPIARCPKCNTDYDLRVNKIYEEEGIIEFKCYRCNIVWKEYMSSEVKRRAGLEN